MDEIQEFIRQWNYRFPVDYWWRRKHKVAFNSPKHRISNFWDQMFEYHEDMMYKSFEKSEEYLRGENDWLEINENEIERVEDGIMSAMAELEKFKKTYKE